MIVENEKAIRKEILDRCNWVEFTAPNGRRARYPLSDFMICSGFELEHKSLNIIIGLTKNSSHSFIYNTDCRGEIIDRQPIKNVTYGRG